MVFLTGKQDSIERLISSSSLVSKICEVVATVGKASYHVYLVQMLWFGMITGHFDSSSWRKIILCIASWIIAGLGGIAYYYLSGRFGRLLHTKSEG